jgi:hypothetical protein
MNKRVIATVLFLTAASAPLWAQGRGGGVGGGGVGGGVGGGMKGGPKVPEIPNDKNISKEACEWVEPYSKALESAKSSEKFFLVYICEEKGNGSVVANDFFALDVVQLSKTTWVFTKLTYSKEDPELRKLAVKKPGTVLGFDKYGNEWRRLENISPIELKGLLASVPDLVKKFTDKLQADVARAEKADSDKAGKLFADIARIPRKGYKEIEAAAAKVREISERQFKAADLAFAVDEKQGIAILKQMVSDYKELPAGVEAEIRLAEVDFHKGITLPAIQRARGALRMEDQEAFAAPLERAKKLLEKLVAAGEERVAAARMVGLSGDRPKAAALLRQIAVDYAGTEASRKAVEAARAFD